MPNPEEKPEVHLHQYRKVGKSTYRCMKVGCTHNLQKDFLENRIAECPVCGQPFTVTREHLRRVVIKHVGDCKPVDVEREALSPFEKLLQQSKGRNENQGTL